jgi:hypothetical protein
MRTILNEGDEAVALIWYVEADHFEPGHEPPCDHAMHSVTVPPRTLLTYDDEADNGPDIADQLAGFADTAA